MNNSTYAFTVLQNILYNTSLWLHSSWVIVVYSLKTEDNPLVEFLPSIQKVLGVILSTINQLWCAFQEPQHLGGRGQDSWLSSKLEASLGHMRLFSQQIYEKGLGRRCHSHVCSPLFQSPALGSSTHIRWLQTTCTSSLRSATALLRPSPTCSHIWTILRLKHK